MREQGEEATPADEPSPALPVSPEKACFIIIKAREFDGEVVLAEPGREPDPSGDVEERIAFDEDEDDPAVEELTSFIGSLSLNEQIDLVALTGLGRDDYSADDLPALREEAAGAHNERTAAYLPGIPQLDDFLEEGLSMPEYPCEDLEKDRL